MSQKNNSTARVIRFFGLPFTLFLGLAFGIILARQNIYPLPELIDYYHRVRDHEPSASASKEKGTLQGDALLSRLRSGGLYLFMRHALKEKVKSQNALDRIHAFPELSQLGRDIKKECCLDAEGVNDAKSLGKIIAALGIPIGKVSASPTCRTRQTAELTFHRVDEISPALLYNTIFSPQELVDVTTSRQRLFDEPLVPRTNRVFVTHADLDFPDLGITMSPLEEGGVLVYEKNSKGKFQKIATLNLFDWTKLIPIKTLKAAHTQTN